MSAADNVGDSPSELQLRRNESKVRISNWRAIAIALIDSEAAVLSVKRLLISSVFVSYAGKSAPRARSTCFL